MNQSSLSWLFDLSYRRSNYLNAMITRAMRTLPGLGLAIFWLLCMPCIASAQDDPGSLTYYASSARSYLVEDGLIDRCVQSAFLTQDGRLNIIPCNHAQTAHEVYLYQFDGFRSYKQRPHVLPDSGQWSIVITDINQERVSYGYLLEYSDAPTPLFKYFSLGTKYVVWTVLDPPKHEGKSVNIRSVREFNGEVYMLGQLPDQIFVYRLDRNREWDFVSRVDAPGAGGALRLPLAFEIEGNVMWTESWSGTAYRIEMQTSEVQSIRGPDFGNIPRADVNRFIRLPDGKMLFSIHGSTAFEVDTVSGLLRPYVPDWITDPLSKGDWVKAFRDEEGNILITCYTESQLEGWLITTNGQTHNYTPALQNLQGLSRGILRTISFTSTDFRRRHFYLGDIFGVVEVTSREFVQAVPGPPIRGYVKRGENEYLLQVRNSTLYFDGEKIRIKPTVDSSCINLWYPDGSIVRLDKDRFVLGSGANGAWVYNVATGSCRSISPEAQVVRISNIQDDYIAYLADDQLAGFDLKTGEFETLVDTMFESHVNAVHITSNGSIYIGSADGLYRLEADSRSLKFIHLGGDRDEQQVLSIFEDVYGQLWIGTYGQGLKIFNPATGDIRQITVDEGLSSNIVASTITDQDGDIWVGTYSGITMYDKDANLLGYLYEEGGLVDNECNRWSAFLMEDGKMFFGTPEGFSIIDADGVKSKLQDALMRKIYMTRLEFDGNRYDAGDDGFDDILMSAIEIPADNRSIRVSYGLSNYAAPQASNYAYKFDRQGDEWNYVGGLYDLSLSNLPDGEYDLLIKGSDALGRSSANVLRIPLDVKRFFYQSWWFYVICSIPFLAFAALWVQRQRLERERLEEEVAKRTETIRNQTEELRELDRMKTRLYTNITHEFRTPLTVIQGLAGRASEDPAAETLIRRNADNLLNLVNQMLDLRKLESGNLSYDPVQGDIVAYMRYIGESFRSLASGKNLAFHFLSERKELIMDYDPEKLARVVTNLLSNAMKFTPEFGDVYLQLDSSGLDKGSVSIKVTDTGIGIPEEQQKRIFERFYQVDDSMTRRGEGTGIGLTLAAEFVQLMNGSIEVFSKPGEGATFVVELPVTHEAELEKSPPYTDIFMGAATSKVTSQVDMTPGAADERNTVLIVEDNPDVVHYIGKCLESDFKLYIAMDGQEGIEKALDLVPDLIVSDVMMPRKDGFALLETLKTDALTSHIPIILLTAKADAESRIEGLSRGADAYLEKPFDSDELVVRIEALIESRKKLQARYAGMNPLVPSGDEDVSVEDAFISRLREAILGNIEDETFGIAELCDVMHLGRTQLHNKVKALTGKSTSIYVRSIRLNASLELLKKPALNVSEVAYAVGFKDPKYFARLFKEEHGISPSEWARKAIQSS